MTVPALIATLIARLTRFRAWISIRIAGWFSLDAGIGGGSDPPDEIA